MLWFWWEKNDFAVLSEKFNFAVLAGKINLQS